MDRPKVGIGVIVEREGHLLLLKRGSSHVHGTWAFPGGHLEYGETPEECARREALEEVGIGIESATIVAITDDRFDNGSQYITLWLKAEGIGDEPVAVNPAEASEHGWFPLDALPSPLFPPLVSLLAGNSLIPFDPSSLA